jgi:uncharacterized protein (DUF488 family)
MPRRTDPTRVVTTIGVYGWTLESFLGALRGANAGLVLDVRQRRGVRGSEYAWANSARLQDALASAGIEYRHLKELAPTTELRKLQHAEDDRHGVGRRARTELAPPYRRLYTSQVLERVDFATIAAELPTDTAAALLCVERDPQACHRSLVADRLAERHGATVLHLLPPS